MVVYYSRWAILDQENPGAEGFRPAALVDWTLEKDPKTGRKRWPR